MADRQDRHVRHQRDVYPGATDGPSISEEEHEVVLHAEKPVVDKKTVAVERVKLGTETVRDDETVTGEVRKEQIETDGDVDPGSQRCPKRSVNDSNQTGSS